MNFKKLQEIYTPHFYSLLLDKFFPKIFRTVLRKLSALLAITSFVLSFDVMPFYLGNADGMFFLFIFIYIILFFTEVFYRSMKGEGLQVLIPENILDHRTNLDYSLSSVLFATDEIDVTKALFETKIGIEILIRSGIPTDLFKGFVYSNRSTVLASSLVLNTENIDLPAYVSALYDADKSLQSFLSGNSVNKGEFAGAASWVMNTENKKLRKERFWSRENLGRIPSIGTSWSYGVASDLGKYSFSFKDSVSIDLLDIENGYREKEVSLLENILERRHEANAIIIDDDEGVARDIISRLVKKMNLGISLPRIEHKNILELDWNSLISAYKNKSELESELLKIFNQSVLAGNIILYVRDLSGFVQSVKVMGINLGSLLSPYLASPSLQVIASATNTDFHFFIETLPTLLERFERIIPDKAGVEASVPALLEQAYSIEGQYKIIFSYSAVLALANSADRFVTYGEMPGKALDMLVEIAPWAHERGISIIKENDVAVFVSEKTGINTGNIKEEEALKISHLSELIHKRIIGQEEAVEGIASAMRRSRSGVGNPKRPLSSFLFLGPTGVGKTEVSKALAESFFGDEDKMIRFDMSEYNGGDAFQRLIGDFAANRTGILASKIRDNPYSVLLLDEFEKAAPDVMDLFLQVLDEGVFTDALGRQVGCRNLIIIATSNAGSSFIWDTVKSGKDLTKEKQNIINEIIERKTFKPELLNRFDGIILFHPLQDEELKKIAVLGLQKLSDRLKTQNNIELSITNEIINFLAEKGSDPQFGGRSINRIIQDKIEDLVAKKIVSGEIGPGSKIEIKKEELT